MDWLGALTGGAGALAGAPTSSTTGPVSAGPVSVNVSGFGSKSSGSASGGNAAPSDAFAPSGAAGASWYMPAAVVFGALLIALALGRR